MYHNFVATWRPGTENFYKDVNPQKVAEEIYALGDKVETKDILDMARDETTEMHKIIEWDDNKSAEKYRLHQVRLTMHDLQIVKVGLNDEKPPETIGVPLRMYYNLKDETGYRPLPKIIADEDLHKQLLMTALSELNAFTIKYATLEELYPIFEAIRNFKPPAA